MDTITCPYCNSEVDINQVEAEEGCCPECGATITPTSIFSNPYDDIYEADNTDELMDSDVEDDLDDDLDDDLVDNIEKDFSDDEDLIDDMEENYEDDF